MTIRAGRMRHRIDIQARALTPDAAGTGEQSYVWSSVVGGGVAAEFSSRPIGREAQVGEQLQARASAWWRIRWMPGLTDTLTPRMRVTWVDPAGRARWFDVLEVQMVDGLPHEIVLVTEELVEAPL